jgi:hypothetical protein
MFLIFRLIRILLPVLQDYFEDRRAERERARHDDTRGPNAVLRQEGTGDPLTDTLSAYRRGDYRGAYEAAAGMSDGDNPHAREADYFQGAVLLAEGRLEEAEVHLRKYLNTAKDPARLGSASGMLGELLIEQGKYGEAAGLLNTGMTLAPEQSALLRQLAVVALRQGEEPSLAIQFANEAVHKERVAVTMKQQRAALAAEQTRIRAQAEIALAADRKKKRFPWQKSNSSAAASPAVAAANHGAQVGFSEFREANMAENLAALAWAVAASGQNEAEVDKLVNEALPLANGKGVSTRGEVHFHAACAYAEMGVQVKSTKHFTQAASADPNGRWGKAAKNMLMAATPR